MDNFSSYSRFTSVDPNIAQYGATVEEFKLQRGAPDPNPVVSPLASPGVTEVRLALVRDGSDQTRVNTPVRPDVNPFEGPKRLLTLSRAAVQKLRGGVVIELQTLIQNGDISDPKLKDHMLVSLHLLRGMREFVDQLNGWAELVDARSLAASKG